MLLPPGLPVLTTLGGLSEAQEWLSALPSLIADVAARWQLRLSPPLHGGSCSWVAPCETPDGTAAVVKIGWPHREMYGEPAALRAWAGRGAVRMLAHDPQRHALLLQRCDPGTELLAWPGDQLVTGCAVLRTLRDVPLPAGISSTPDEPGISLTRDQSGPGSPGNDLSQGIEPLAVVAAEWAARTQERMERLRPPYDPALVAAGVDLMRSLPVSAEGTVLLHGDFNPGNVLAHGDTWLAIDPKPMTGDPAYDPWPLIEQVEDDRPVRERFTIAAGELGLDAERLRAWAFARSVEAALWSADTRGDVAGGAAALERARTVRP